MSARDPDELSEKSSSYQGRVLAARRRNLQTYIDEAKELAETSRNGDEVAYAKSMMEFLATRIDSNEALWAIYNGKVTDEKTNELFETSRKIWAHVLPETLDKLEGVFEGPFLFGDQIVSLN